MWGSFVLLRSDFGSTRELYPTEILRLRFSIFERMKNFAQDGNSVQGGWINLVD